MKILVLFGSTEGQTYKIAQCIADAIHQCGHEVEVVSAEIHARIPSLGNYDGVIIGASVHKTKYPKYVVNFIKHKRGEIDRLPNAFFSVCMAAYDQSPAGREETRQYTDSLVSETGWTPKQIKSFAGAITYTQYNFLLRLVMKFIAKKKQLSTDTSRDHDYTNWDDVRQYAKDFVAAYFK